MLEAYSHQDKNDNQNFAHTNIDEDYQIIKNYLFLLRANTPDQKEIADHYFENNKNKKFVYESLIKITENIYETQDLRMQAIVILKKLYNLNINGNYLKYEKEKNELDFIYETKFALLSENMFESQNFERKSKKINSKIDSLPYIDQHYKEDTRIKEEMNRLIKDELNYLATVKSADDYLKDYSYPELKHLNNPMIKSELERIEKDKKLNIFHSEIKTKFEDPAPNKYHDKDNWNKLIQNVQLSIQQMNVKNLNLDLLIKYGPDAWKKYLRNFENTINQLEIEKMRLETESEEINKERKFMQVRKNL